MAEREDIEQPLTLEFTADAVAPRTFERAVAAFFAIVEGTQRNEGFSLTWTVEVKKGSNLIGMRPVAPPNHELAVTGFVATIASAIDLLASEPKEPREFNDRALRGVRTLARLSTYDAPIRLWTEFEPKPLSDQIYANVNELIEGSYIEEGSVEGRLQTVSERNGFRFVIYEPMRDRPIRCTVPEERQAEVMRAFGQRVEIYGPVRYRNDGTPTAITVEDFIAFPEAKTLPSAFDVRGILRNHMRDG